MHTPSDTGLIARTYKATQPAHQVKNLISPIREWGEEMNRHLPQEDIGVASKYMKKIVKFSGKANQNDRFLTPI